MSFFLAATKIDAYSLLNVPCGDFHWMKKISGGF